MRLSRVRFCRVSRLSKAKTIGRMAVVDIIIDYGYVLLGVTVFFVTITRVWDKN